jgi:hypothetical protein
VEYSQRCTKCTDGSSIRESLSDAVLELRRWYEQNEQFDCRYSETIRLGNDDVIFTINQPLEGAVSPPSFDIASESGGGGGGSMNRPIKLTCDVMNEVTNHSFIQCEAMFKRERESQP